MVLAAATETGFYKDVALADTEEHFKAKKNQACNVFFYCRRFLQVTHLIQPLEWDKSSRLH